MRKWGKIGGLALLVSTLLSPLQFNAVYAAGVDRENISYISMNIANNWGNFVTHIDTEAKMSQLDVVSPNFYKINNDEDETLNRDAIRQGLVDEMHKRGIRVVPFLQNDWENTITLKNRDVLAEQLASDVVKYNYDGINIDLENINPKYRDSLTDFVVKLRSKLAPEKQLSVAVAAVSKNVPEGWQQTYDYKKIADALGPNDCIVIMAYDEFGNDKGPVAQYSFVENAIKYGIKQGVPKEKIVLGIPLYGRIWGSNTGSEPIPHWKIFGDSTDPGVIKTFNPKITFNQSTQTYEAKFTLAKDSSYKINQDYMLTAGDYTIWYDNEELIKKKLSLVQKYHLKGASSWSLAQEYTPMWDYYNDWLNGEYVPAASTAPVVNIVTNQSKLISGTAEPDAKILVKNGSKVLAQTTVSATGTFSVGIPLQKEGTELVITATDLGGNVSQATKFLVIPAFTDLGGVPWAKPAIETMASLGIIKGMDVKTFAPNNNVTRAQFAKLIIKTLGITGTASEPFTDVNSSDWFANDVALAYKYDIVRGKSNTSFAPNEPITRQEMAVMMVRAIQLKQSIKAEDVTGTLSKFTDRNQIDTWAKESVAIAVEQELMNGVTTTTFSPKTNATRAQSAVIMYRFYNKFMK